MCSLNKHSHCGIYKHCATLLQAVLIWRLGLKIFTWYQIFSCILCPDNLYSSGKASSWPLPDGNFKLKCHIHSISIQRSSDGYGIQQLLRGAIDVCSHLPEWCWYNAFLLKLLGGSPKWPRQPAEAMRGFTAFSLPIIQLSLSDILLHSHLSWQTEVCSMLYQFV